MAARHALRTVVVMLAILAVLGGCRAMTGRTAGDVVDDATITASVKSKLVGDRAANLTRVDVDTTNGTVYLNGTVENPEQKTRAEHLAWQASGVKNVVNNLQVERRP
jgi:hyperosmotically inducible protein